MVVRVRRRTGATPVRAILAGEDASSSALPTAALAGGAVSSISAVAESAMRATMTAARVAPRNARTITASTAAAARKTDIQRARAPACRELISVSAGAPAIASFKGRRIIQIHRQRARNRPAPGTHPRPPGSKITLP
jgi:hypothetical protein